MEMVDAMMDSKEEISSEHGSPTMIRNSPTQLESGSGRNDQLPGSENSRKRLASPNDLRNDPNSSTAASLAHDEIATKRPFRSLQCIRCAKLRRSCSGMPGESCNRCVNNNIRCSFLDPRPFRCKLCPRDYTTESNLRGHITRKHAREISHSVDLDVPEAPRVTSSPPSSIHQIPTNSSQNIETDKISENPILDLSCTDTTRPSDQAESQRHRWPDSGHLLSRIPAFQQQPFPQDPEPATGRLNPPEMSSGEAQYGIACQRQDQHLRFGENPIPEPYQELHFEIFDTYERRNLSQDYVQRTLDGIREDIEQYGEFIRGKDRDTSAKIRERLRFLDEVRPLIHLWEIDNETSEMYGIQDSRLVTILRSIFFVKDNTRLEQELEILGPEVRLLRLPHLVCGVLAYYVLQLFTEKDLIRKAELKATELTHGITQAANAIQHSRLSAQECYIFQARLENRAKKLAPSLYDLIRPLTHWKQDSLHNGRAEQHIERLRKIILDSLCLAAELEARKGTFSFFWPRSRELFDPSRHSDEADDSTPERNRNRGRQRLVAFTLMPGVIRMMENRELNYAKATVISMQRDENGGL